MVVRQLEPIIIREHLTVLSLCVHHSMCTAYAIFLYMEYLVCLGACAWWVSVGGDCLILAQGSLEWCTWSCPSAVQGMTINSSSFCVCVCVGRGGGGGGGYWGCGGMGVYMCFANM